MNDERPTFDPSKYLSKIGGADYLEVKWRLLWLRSEHPDAIIRTTLYADNGERAIFKARIRIPGGGSATGWGDETLADFRDYLPKAETKAVGRALAALGFGTQFCRDFEFGAEQGRVVDGPVDLQAASHARRLASGAGNDPATDRQIKAVYAIGRAARLTDAAIAARVQEQYGCAPEQLQRRDASAFIDALKAELAASAAGEVKAQ